MTVDAELAQLADRGDEEETQALVLRDDAMMSLGPVESTAVQQQADPYYGAASLELSARQQEILSRPFEPSELEILPTGEVYAPQVEYRRRLNEAFGIGRWALRPLADPKRAGKTVVRWYALYVDGRFASETFGEADFIENNSRFTWGTALESAKSNALMRCCKDIGVNLECWSKAFTSDWQRRYAIRVDGKWQKKELGAGDGKPSATQHNNSEQSTSKTSRTSTSGSGSASTPNPPNESASPAPSVVTVRPVKFGKGWKLASGESCMYLFDDQDQKWSVIGGENIDTAERAILQKKQVKLTYKENKGYRNVSACEVVQ